LIEETTGASRAEFAPYLYHYTGTEVVTHLCRVAAGLDSMILGEPQILGQVTRAYQAALRAGAAGPALSALFRTAIHAGKRARAETAISRNPASVSAVAVRLAQGVVSDLAAAHVLIVGAGEMAELALEALRARGAADISVLNRTFDRAEQLAQRWGARALTLDRLAEALSTADIVITSSGAPHMMISPQAVRTAIASRPDRPLVFIDIAVPRNVHPGAARLPNVHCFNIDDLHSHLDEAVADRGREVPRVEAILAEEVTAFEAWWQGREVTPVIARLHAKADAIRRAEVEKALRHLPQLGAAERWRIEALTESLVNKLLHDPTRCLKAEADRGHAAEYAAMIRHLFALSG